MSSSKFSWGGSGDSSEFRTSRLTSHHWARNLLNTGSGEQSDRSVGRLESEYREKDLKTLLSHLKEENDQKLYDSLLPDSDSEDPQRKVIFVARGSNSGVKTGKEEENNSDEQLKDSDAKVGTKKCGCTRFACDGRHTLITTEKKFKVTKIQNDSSCIPNRKVRRKHMREKNLYSSGVRELRFWPEISKATEPKDIPLNTLIRVKTEPLRTLDAPKLLDDFYLNLIDWSSKNNLVIGLDQEVHIHRPDSGKGMRLCKLRCDGAQEDAAAATKWNPDGRHLAIGTFLSGIHYYDAKRGKPLRTYETAG